MNHTQKIGSVLVASLFAVMPFAASAASVNASGSTGIFISPSGVVHVIGAQVTSVSSGVVNVATTIGSTVLNWIVDVSASTKIAANGTRTATTTDIHVGDKIGFAGALSASTSTLTVAATKIRDITNFPFRFTVTGTISSVNTANSSFVITRGKDKAVTVNTTGSTVVTINGATSTLASLSVGSKVSVSGTANADGSVITASKVVVRTPEVKPEVKKEKDDQKNDGDNEHVWSGLRLFDHVRIGIGKDK